MGDGHEIAKLKQLSADQKVVMGGRRLFMADTGAARDASDRRLRTSIQEGLHRTERLDCY